MGNRAVITTKDHGLALYLHWNGGRDTVEPLLKYCELKGYRSPSSDCYGWARLAQVIGNFFGGTLSVGIDRFDRLGDQGDNGVYVIDGWEIVGREGLYDGFTEQAVYPFDEMLRSFDESMPEGERLGEYLNSVEIATSDLELGDEVWKQDFDDGLKTFPVVGFGTDADGCGKQGVPYIAWLDHDGDWAWNPNNWIKSETVRIKPRG